MYPPKSWLEASPWVWIIYSNDIKKTYRHNTLRLNKMPTVRKIGSPWRRCVHCLHLKFIDNMRSIHNFINRIKHVTDVYTDGTLHFGLENNIAA